MSSNWIPEIMYEESEDGESSNIPFIMVPQSELMPKMVFIFESRETGEFEPGLEGEEVPVVQWDLHQYADMAVLKQNMSPIEYDNVRFALGLEPLITALSKGTKITDRIRDKVNTD
tara:strand:- start:504 stop:851 length:348 start_codon:yes stop_codon:yes gene_type:complete